MATIDCAARIEPHWRWESHPFVAQSYHWGDEFQEFGLRWRGTGFTHVTAPGWRIRGARRLDAYPLSAFVGVATVVDATDAASVGPERLGAATADAAARGILVLRTGHADRVGNRSPAYWRDAPEIDPGVADLAAERGCRHLAVDLPCDDVPAGRPDGEGGFRNPNGALRRRAHELGLLVTENCANLSALDGPEAFFASLPILAPGATTGPCRPVALTAWRSDRPTVRELSTPLENHWRWRMDMKPGMRFEDGDDADETHYQFGGHGFTHCDAPCHMYKVGARIQELPNEGLDLFVGDAFVIDLSDHELPFPVTRALLADRAKGLRRGDLAVLRTDLTNRVGYASREWHLRAPYLEADAAAWLADRGPAAVCLDFPQDRVAREMPTRHVRNEEFVAHHAVFRRNIPFVEDLRDLGDLETDRPYLLALPLRMTCVDGAPMRVVAIEW